MTGVGSDAAPLSARATAADRAEELVDAVARFRRAARHAAPSPVSALTGSQVELLRLVRAQPGVSVGEVAVALRLAENTVSTLVRQLVESKMLLRAVDDVDRRVARLRLTPAAARRIRLWRADRVGAVAAAIEMLNAHEGHQVTVAVEVLQALSARLGSP